MVGRPIQNRASVPDIQKERYYRVNYFSEGVLSSKGRLSEDGRLATARPLTGVAGHGDRLQGARKGLLPAASPTASKGSGAGRRGGRPLAGRLPAGMVNWCLRRGRGGDGGVVRVKEG
ncbi:hypothetical protein BHM03_00041271 [Ensete ventricosum]|nr:hypothetical protein BHM03_00041271 [Ensete ventricosum]